MVKKYAELFTTFAKVGVLTFGGGYAMLPILQREVVEKKHYATDEELMDYYAIGQCTPGVIAVNTATFVGQKIAGMLGGIIATAGVVFPSLLIIMAIAAFISGFADMAVVQNAFAGVRVCVCVLIFNAVLKLFRSSVTDGFTFLVFAVVFIIMMFCNFSPAWLVLAAGIAGVVYRGLRGAKK